MQEFETTSFWVQFSDSPGVLAYLDVSIDIEGDEIAPAVVAEWLAYMRLEE